jgi:site-specific recombinase XerD
MRAMNFARALDLYIADMTSQGRLNSESAVRGYRSTLEAHAEDVGNRDPRYVGRDHVKRTLRRWAHPNTQATNRSKLVSFYDWAMEEGIRNDNPARQTRRPRRRTAKTYRMPDAEARALLEAACGPRERRAIYLLMCAGLRNAEIRGLRGYHFEREGFIRVPPDIAKGRRERWVRVLADLEPIVAEIVKHVGRDEYVLPAQRFRNPPHNTERRDLALRPSSSQAPRQLVMRVSARAGIAAHIHPHLLRHAFASHVARQADTRSAQHLLGHANLGTTDTYLADPSLDDMAAAVVGVTYGIRTDVPGVALRPVSASKATAGIEPA